MADEASRIAELVSDINTGNVDPDDLKDSDKEERRNVDPGNKPEVEKIKTLEAISHLIPQDTIDEILESKSRFREKYKLDDIVEMDIDELKRAGDSITVDLFSLKLKDPSYFLGDDFRFLTAIGNVVVTLIGLKSRR